VTDDSQDRSAVRKRGWPRGTRAGIAYMVTLGAVVSIATQELVTSIVIAVGLLLTVAIIATLMRLIGNGKR